MRIYVDRRGGARIHGSIPELALVAKGVSDLISGAKTLVRYNAETTGSSEPYTGFLEALEFSKTQGPIIVTIADERTLRVTGGQENLATYASQFIFGGEAVSGDRHHPDLGYPADYISARSVDVVIEVE